MTHGIARPAAPTHGTLSNTVPGMLSWLCLALLKPPVAYGALGAVAVPLALAMPDPVTFLGAMGVLGTGLGLLYGAFYVSSRGKIAPFEQGLREIREAAERAIRIKRAEVDREIELRRAALDREMEDRRAEAARARVTLDAEAAARAAAVVAAARASAVRVEAAASTAAIELVERAKKHSVVEQLERAESERTELAARLDEVLSRLARAEGDLAASDERYRALDDEFLDFARLVINRHGHSPGDPADG